MLSEDKVEKYNDKLRDVRRDIKTVINFGNQYNGLSNEYMLYLKGTKTAASLREEVSHRLIASSVRSKVDYIITEIKSSLTDNVPSYTQFAENDGQTEGLPLYVKEEVVRNLSYSSFNKEYLWESVGVALRHKSPRQLANTSALSSNAKRLNWDCKVRNWT